MIEENPLLIELAIIHDVMNTYIPRKEATNIITLLASIERH